VQPYVASFFACYLVSEFLEGFYCFPAGDSWELRHTPTETVCRLISVGL